MYWFPRKERTGNRPVWSEYDLEVLELTYMIAARMLYECCYCLGCMFLKKS